MPRGDRRLGFSHLSRVFAGRRRVRRSGWLALVVCGAIGPGLGRGQVAGTRLQGERDHLVLVAPARAGFTGQRQAHFGCGCRGNRAFANKSPALRIGPITDGQFDRGTCVSRGRLYAYVEFRHVKHTIRELVGSKA